MLSLWSREMEAEREEARAAVANGFATLRDFLTSPETPPADVRERVRQARERMNAMSIRAPEGSDRDIAGVRCRVFLPPQRARAVYLHFHGGGMMTGTPELNDVPNRDLSRAHGVAVVSADYRLGPEHPYPAGPDDGLAVAAWLLEHGERELGSGRLLLGGESAGGYMSAAVALRIRDRLGTGAIERVLGTNLVFGVYDWGRSPSQRGIRPHDGPDLLDPDGICFFTDCYLPGRSDDERRDPAISPAFADLRGLPPALMSVGSTDHPLDDTLMLASRSAAAGNEVELFVAPDMPHGFTFFPCAITRRHAELTAQWFARMLGGR